MENKTPVWWWVGGVAVIVLVILAVVFNQGSAPASESNGEATSTVEVGTNATSTATAPASTAAVPLTYKQALVKYAKARIQFDASCSVVIPNSYTFKNGTYIMLDNRSPQARTIHIGDYYRVPGYGFRVVYLSASKLPATLYVDCGAAQNVATVLLQR